MAAQIREVEQSRQEVVRSALEVGFPRRTRSSIQTTDARLSSFSPQLMGHKFICLSSLPCPLGAGHFSGAVGSGGCWHMGSILHKSLEAAVWGHGPGRRLSMLDTFIFPESNSASGRARSRGGLFGCCKLESSQWVSCQGTSGVGGWGTGAFLTFATLTAQGPHLPVWLPCLPAT